MVIEKVKCLYQSKLKMLFSIVTFLYIFYSSWIINDQDLNKQQLLQNNTFRSAVTACNFYSQYPHHWKLYIGLSSSSEISRTLYKLYWLPKKLFANYLHNRFYPRIFEKSIDSSRSVHNLMIVIKAHNSLQSWLLTSPNINNPYQFSFYPKIIGAL